MRQLNYAVSPGLTNVSVDWGGIKVEQAPRKLKVLFNGSRELSMMN